MERLKEIKIMDRFLSLVSLFFFLLGISCFGNLPMPYKGGSTGYICEGYEGIQLVEMMTTNSRKFFGEDKVLSYAYIYKTCEIVELPTNGN